MRKLPKAMPTGSCWCGCGDDVPKDSFFLAGHDRRAESAVIRVEYGRVVEFLNEHGYGPGGKNAMKEIGAWRERHQTAR